MSRNRYDQVEKPPEPKNATDVLYQHAALSARCDYFAYVLAQRTNEHVGLAVSGDDCTRLTALLTRCATQLRERGT